MTDPETHNAMAARQELAQLESDLVAFEAEMADAGVEHPVRDRLRSWWEALLGGRILDRAERRLRGIQRRA